MEVEELGRWTDRLPTASDWFRHDHSLLESEAMSLKGQNLVGIQVSVCDYVRR
jgi:hypothetical protein